MARIASGAIYASGKLTGSLAFPVFCVPREDLLWPALRNIEWISSSGGNRIQLVFQPLVGKFRECLASSRCNGVTSTISSSSRMMIGILCKMWEKALLFW